MNRRFIGGPHDGQWLDVWDNPIVYMPIVEPVPSLLDAWADDAPLRSTLRVAVYELCLYAPYGTGPAVQGTVTRVYRFDRIETR